MQVNLNRSLVIIKDKKTPLNLNDQYSFFFLLRILKSNFDALSICGLSLSEIIKQKDAYTDFLDAYRSSVVRIIEKGFTAEYEGDEATVEEMKKLWQQVYQLCLDILASSINMTYTDTKDILVNLKKNLS